MKLIVAAFALAIATPAAAQPAPHRDHAEQQPGAQHQGHAEPGQSRHQGHGEGCPCCAPGVDGQRPPCCERMHRQHGAQPQGAQPPAGHDDH